MDKNKSKSSDKKPTIANSLIRNVPFVRPHSVLNSRNRITTNPGSALSSRSERGARSAMSYNVQRPLTAPASKTKNLNVVDRVAQEPLKEPPKPIIKSARDSQFNNESMTRGVESFEDESLRKVYLDICRERDAIPKHSIEKIELLKRIDPVFAKRYKEFRSAVVGGHAPRFNVNDHNLLHSTKQIPKKKLDQQKKGIITILDNERLREPQRIIHQERTQFDHRVKMFIRSLAELS